MDEYNVTVVLVYNAGIVLEALWVQRRHCIEHNAGVVPSIDGVRCVGVDGSKDAASVLPSSHPQTFQARQRRRAHVKPKMPDKPFSTIAKDQALCQSAK